MLPEATGVLGPGPNEVRRVALALLCRLRGFESGAGLVAEAATLASSAEHDGSGLRREGKLRAAGSTPPEHRGVPIGLKGESLPSESSEAGGGSAK